MSKSFEAGPRFQRGDILLESLIGIVLMAIIGLGMTYASSRAAVSQRDMKVQNIAVSQMRDLIARYGPTLCSNTSLAKVVLPTQTTAISLTATCVKATPITVDGILITPSDNLGTVVLTTPSSESTLFGGVIRVGDET